LGTRTITLVVNDGKVDSEPDTVNITVERAVPLVPTVSQRGAIGMIIALASCIVWRLRKRRGLVTE